MSRVLTTIVVGVAITALFVFLDLAAAFFIYIWAGGDFGGYGASAHPAAGWAFPAWLALTAAFVVLDFLAIRLCATRHRRTSVRET